MFRDGFLVSGCTRPEKFQADLDRWIDNRTGLREIRQPKQDPRSVPSFATFRRIFALAAKNWQLAEVSLFIYNTR